MIKSIKLKNFFGYVYVFLIFSIIFLGRPFTGLKFFGFRLGEILVGIGLVLVFLIIFRLRFVQELSFVFYTHLYLIFLFLTYVIFNGFSEIDTYMFKSSSFIWMISYIYLGYFLSKIQILENAFLFFTIPLVLIFIFSFYKYPQFLIYFFTNFSDKFDFPTGSDLLLLLVLSNFLVRNYIKNKSLYFWYFFISFSVFLPGLLFKSKGAFLPAALWIIVELVLMRKYLIKNYLRSLLAVVVGTVLFIASTLFIWGDLTFGRIAEIEEEEDISSIVSDTLTKNVQKNQTNEIFYSFYISDNRLFSTNNTANWRLQIWQDVYYDLLESGKLVAGYGYFEIIPAMDTPVRQGNDGTNEHVHNFLVNILARAGLLGVLGYIILLYQIIKIYNEKENNYQIIHFIFPLLLTSFFDSSMESVRFPFITYTFIGFFIGYEKEKQ